MANILVDQNNLRDPLQGYDIKVDVITGAGASGQNARRLVGAFTSLMFKVVNQTETYLPLNSRIPRMLDGEMIVVWSLEQGLIDLAVLRNTFGKEVSEAFQVGRGALIPRQARFSISFRINSPDSTEMVSSTASDVTFNAGGLNGGSNADTTKSLYRLDFCRVDTMNFGVTAGRHVVANTWQGTAQNIGVIQNAGGATGNTEAF
jgi:hypothetical protein